MSLHLGSSKYDEHTVRKGISNWHFDHQVNKGTLSISIPCALSASQVIVKCVNCNASLGDEAAEPRQGWLSSRQCGSLWPRLLPIALPSTGVPSCLARHHSPQTPGQHPRPAWSHSPWESRDVPLGSRSVHSRGCYLLWAGKDVRLALIASAGKASKAGSKVSVTSQEQSRHAQLTAESSPVRTVTPKHLSCLPVNLSPWTLQLQFYLPCLFPLKSMSLERERNSTGKKRRISRKGMWVRTRESGGGLSKGSKGGLLHSQLVELGQLLRGRRDIRAKKVIVIE